MWYRNGTISLVNGSKVVTGAGTAWVDAIIPSSLMVTPSGVVEVKRVVSDTEIELAVVYQGANASGIGYAIAPTQSYLIELADSVTGVLEDFGDIRQAWLAGDLKGDAGAGLTIKGTVPDYAALQTKPQVAGTGWFIGDHLWVWTGTAWFDTGAIRGPKGDDGPPNSLAIGTVTQGATAAASISGEAPAQVLDLTLPKGDKGDEGEPGAKGWAPVFAIVTDGSRRVLQVSDWVGGEGAKPVTGQYVGASGLVTPVANAVDVRGAAGGQGNPGPANALAIGTVSQGAAAASITGNAPSQTLNLTLPKGDTGNAGWSPVVAVVNDGERRVMQVVEWTGGAGSKPTVGLYIGPTGFVVPIASALDVRGPAGAAGSGSGSVSPSGAIFANRLAVFNDTTGNLIKDGGVLVADLATVTNLTNGLATKATPADISAAVAGKANTSDVNTALAAKADASAVTSAMATKADLVGGYLNPAQLPPLAISETFTVATQAAMLALTAQRGDVAIRTDINTSFILAADAPGTLANWKQLLTPGQVVSVAGRTGAVVLTIADITGLSADLATRATYDFLQGELANKASLVGGKVPTDQLPAFPGGTVMVADYDARQAVSPKDPTVLYLMKDSNTLARWRPENSDFLTVNPVSIYSHAVIEGAQSWALDDKMPTVRAVQEYVALKLANISSSTIPVNAQGGAFTLALSDAGKELRVTSATAVVVTVPTHAAVAIPVDTVIVVSQFGAGVVSVAGSGITFRYRSGRGLKVDGLYNQMTLKKVAVNEWLVVGGIL